MRTANHKEVLTTGQVAKICHVAPRTVSKWFDTGRLRGYRIPGSRDRRIPIGQLVAFMQAHGIPLDGMDEGAYRILIMDPQASESLIQGLTEIAGYEVRTAQNGFQAGVLAQQFHPHVIVLDAAAVEEAVVICQNIKAHDQLHDTRVLAAVSDLDEATRHRLESRGFDECLAKPYSLRRLVKAAEGLAVAAK